jgi:hypothetical protein
MRYIVIIVMLLVLTGVAQALQTIPIEVDTTVDFQSPTSFRIIMPNGLERYFDWNANQTHSDATFTHTIYHEVDEVDFCNRYADLGTYINISEGMLDMVGTCRAVMVSWNDTAALRNQVNEAIKDRDIYQGMLDSCKSAKTDAENYSDTWRLDSIAYRKEADDCQNRVTALERKSSEVNTCNQELSDAVSSKSNSLMIGVIGGGAVGWFIWGRKKRRGNVPSEQDEAGSNSDHIRNENLESRGMTFKDGPKI